MTAVFLVGSLLLGGGAAILANETVTSTVGGALAVLCGVVLGWIGALHLRRPVKR